jgi:DNA-binding LacI/PurR family transcriptional regulator
MSAANDSKSISPPTSGLRKRARVQMADIARMAGVSTATVSRAMSGSDLVNEETRHRVMELAAKLNYRVDAAAAGLRKGAITTVGVVLLLDQGQAATDPFMMNMVGHLADELSLRGLDMLLARFDVERREQLAEMVETGRVGGVIVIGQAESHDYLNALALRQFPKVVWGAQMPGTRYTVVGSDNELGGYLATHHLLQRGCRRIAFLGNEDHPEVASRAQGYRRALAEFGLSPAPELQLPVAFTAVENRPQMAAWLQAVGRIDGAFAFSDAVAMGLVAVLADAGLSVPKDVKVVGYDDVVASEFVHPSITSVRQPLDMAARELVDSLLAAIQGREQRSVLLPTTLIERESSAA